MIALVAGNAAVRDRTEITVRGIGTRKALGRIRQGRNGRQRRCLVRDVFFGREQLQLRQRGDYFLLRTGCCGPIRNIRVPDIGFQLIPEQEKIVFEAEEQLEAGIILQERGLDTEGLGSAYIGVDP